MDCRFQSLAGFRIAHNCILYSRAEAPRFHKQKFLGFRNPDYNQIGRNSYLLTKRNFVKFHKTTHIHLKTITKTTITKHLSSHVRESQIPESGKISLEESRDPALSIEIQNPSSTDKGWNPLPGIRNSRRGFKNPRLSCISLARGHSCLLSLDFRPPVYNWENCAMPLSKHYLQGVVLQEISWFCRPLILSIDTQG